MIAYAGLYRVAQQTQVLQEGHLTPYYDHVTLCPTHPHRTLRNTEHFWFVLTRNRPKHVWFRLQFFSVLTDRNRSTFSGKTDIPGRHFSISGHRCVKVANIYEQSGTLLCVRRDRCTWYQYVLTAIYSVRAGPSKPPYYSNYPVLVCCTGTAGAPCFLTSAWCPGSMSLIFSVLDPTLLCCIYYGGP